jgi:hypothetical protein
MYTIPSARLAPVYLRTEIKSIRLELSPIGLFLVARMAVALVIVDTGVSLVVIPRPARFGRHRCDSVETQSSVQAMLALALRRVRTLGGE